MMDALTFLAAPFTMCLVLVGIHCYLGMHVLARGVIFVDLALAQVAALGALLPLAFLEQPSPWVAYFASLGTTLLAAGFLTISNRLRTKVSQEAVIGVVFACSSAALILFVDQMSHGSEHIKHSMVGQLLWATWADVLKVAGIYSVVSICHVIWRKPLLESSFGQSVDWKSDFLFYALFSIVITSSVQVAGILIVFSFLIVPALVSSLFFTGIVKRLLFGWVFGAILCAIGMAGSYQWDLPSGAFIVLLFSIVPILIVSARVIVGNKSR